MSIRNLKAPEKRPAEALAWGHMKSFQRALLLIAGAGVLAFAGCHSIGPGSVPRDRSDYSDNISESWKKQTLLNIVKLRYLDPPIFVDVGQIVSGYTLESALNASGAFSHDPAGAAIGGTSPALGGPIPHTHPPPLTHLPTTRHPLLPP